MASFNFEGGAQGAASGASLGSLAGPYGAAAGAVIGFVAGGFLGGEAEDAAKAREARLAFLASPEHFMDVSRQLAPAQTALAAQTIGPAAKSAAATQSARRGLTGTGLGAALVTNAAAAPGIFGAKAANQQARGVINAEIAALGGTPIPGIVGQQMGGLRGAAEIATLASSLGLQGQGKKSDPLAARTATPRGGTTEVNLPEITPPPKKFSRRRGPAAANPFKV